VQELGILQKLEELLEQILNFWEKLSDKIGARPSFLSQFKI
jgi:hypothetical protein